MSAELAERYREDSARLAELCPEIDLSLWTSVTGQGRARRNPGPRRRCDSSAASAFAGSGTRFESRQVVPQPRVLEQVVAGRHSATTCSS